MNFDPQPGDGWTAVATLAGGVCSGFFGMITACFTAYLTYLMYKLRVGQESAAVEVQSAAVEVQAVKERLEKVDESHSTWLRGVSAKQDAVLKQVDVIEKATNSMKDALVLATEKEALLRGGVQERERASAEQGRDKATAVEEEKQDKP